MLRAALRRSFGSTPSIPSLNDLIVVTGGPSQASRRQIAKRNSSNRDVRSSGPPRARPVSTHTRGGKERNAAPTAADILAVVGIDPYAGEDGDDEAHAPVNDLPPEVLSSSTGTAAEIALASLEVADLQEALLSRRAARSRGARGRIAAEIIGASDAGGFAEALAMGSHDPAAAENALESPDGLGQVARIGARVPADADEEEGGSAPPLASGASAADRAVGDTTALSVTGAGDAGAGDPLPVPARDGGSGGSPIVLSEAAVDALEGMFGAGAAGGPGSEPAVMYGSIPELVAMDPDISDVTSRVLAEEAATKGLVDLEPSRYFDAMGLPRTTVQYNRLLHLQSVSGRHDAFDATVAAMRASGIPMQVHTYGTIIADCARRRDLDGAWRCYEDLVSAGHAPNPVVFGALAHAHRRAVAGDGWRTAHKVIDEMDVHGLLMDTAVATPLVRSCVDAGELDAAWAVHRAMTVRGARPDAIAYTDLITLCTRQGRTERALTLLDEMRSFNVPMTGATYNALLFAVALRISPRDAEPGPDDGGPPVPFASNWNHQFGVLLDQMKEAGFRVSEVTSTALIQRAAAVGDLEGVVSELNAAAERDHLNTLHVASAIRAFIPAVARRGPATEDRLAEEARLLARVVETCGDAVLAAPEVIDAHLAVHAAAMRLHRAQAIFDGLYANPADQAGETGRPDRTAFSYTCLARMYAVAGRTGPATRILRDAVAAGHKIGDLESGYRAIIKRLSARGHIRDALELLLELGPNHRKVTLARYEFVLRRARGYSSRRRGGARGRPLPGAEKVEAFFEAVAKAKGKKAVDPPLLLLKREPVMLPVYPGKGLREDI